MWLRDFPAMPTINLFREAEPVKGEAQRGAKY
jgi:hypothetical protein